MTKRCHKCECMISLNHEVYVKELPYHSKCAPEHTAEIGYRNLVMLRDEVRNLQNRVETLEAHIEELKG